MIERIKRIEKNTFSTFDEAQDLRPAFQSDHNLIAFTSSLSPRTSGFSSYMLLKNFLTGPC